MSWWRNCFPPTFRAVFDGDGAGRGPDCVMRIMGLDLGSKTVGVAISDPGRSIATPLETITRPSEGKLRRTLARIEALIVEYEVGALVLGLPKHMHGEEGERAAKSRDFARILERRTGLEVYLWDERLTTVEAHMALEEAGVRRRDRAKYVDQVAAALILQGYLDYGAQSGSVRS